MLINNRLVGNLGWFLGAGGYFSFFYLAQELEEIGKVSGNRIGLGARVPVGLSLMSGKSFEFVFALTPNVGYYFVTGDFKDAGEGRFAGNVKVDVGFRKWF